ncbi:tetratricopeptide repeat protein [Streptomyces sp. GMY02]|uniref:tetratricopeptide repeat protein n=1 Tax=Streptomyces sp. GMY02 TaxID=1333528 RepID=UPI001C2CAF34|nr:tetratricopeptide repeat protein [Streptomyces sp. GMY02]QXE36771.1 tetratricopeptide repeat protein [Streptomyces sp. GMY02]
MVDLLALGPLELWHEGRQFGLGTVKERCVLAVLVHARGEPVTVDALMDRVWDGVPPATGLNTLHAYLSRLRGRLRRGVGDLAQVKRPSPRQYQLLVDPEDIDLLRFQRLRKDAGAAAGRGERDLALGLLRTAEHHWRGEPLAEFTSAWAATTRARLTEDYRRVREERIRLELELGRHADLIGELHELAAQNPLAQRVIASLMLALYRSGRPDEALALYRTTHRRLHKERDEAVDRLFAYYLTTAHRADGVAHPHRHTRPLAPEQESPYALRFADTDEASVWLTVERANLLAVARRAAAEAPAYAALFPHVLATSLKLWGTWDIAAELYGAAASALRADNDRAALARTLVEHADVLAQKDHDEAQRHAGEALSLFQDLKDPQGRADALLQSGRAHMAAGRGEQALRVLEEAAGLYREVEDLRGEAECLNVQGIALYYAGRYEAAHQRVRTMLTIHERLGDLLGQTKALNNLGELRYIQGRHAEARRYYERSRVFALLRGGRQELSILDTNLGAVHQATGNTDLALAHYQRALRSDRASGDRMGEASILISMGTAYADTGRRGEALLHFTMAEEVARSIDNTHERQRALLGMGDMQRESGRLATARALYEQALEIAQGIGYPLGTAHAFAGLTHLALSSHGMASARHYGDQAIALYEGLDAGTEAQGLRDLLAEWGVTGS